MANLDVLTYGFAFVSDQGGFGWSTISLLSVGDRRMLIDTGPASRRANLVRALADHSLELEDIDTVILTHLHWDHCQNTDLFRNARIVLHPTELDYARNPNRGDRSAAWYIADMLGKMKVEPVSDGDTIAEGVSVVDTPGHTKGHISVLLETDGDKVLVTGDALPDSGTVRRRLPYNVFWDVKDAEESVEKMLDTSQVFYPGHDRPFRLDGEEISYLHGPAAVEVTDSNEGGGAAALTFRVIAKREVNIDPVQKA
jgi:glyoxylase-like metal-dependent hydrolase (beta-lactamase superfamily II)